MELGQVFILRIGEVYGRQESEEQREEKKETDE
jgi:hypothetical protein